MSWALSIDWPPLPDESSRKNLDELCRALGTNCPETKTFDPHKIPKMDDAVALQLGEALRDNTIVEKLRFHIRSCMTATGVEGLVHFISHSPSLRELEIDNRIAWADDNERIMAVTDQLLIAAGISGRIEAINLRYCYWFGADAFRSAMHGLRTSLKYLYLRIPCDGQENGWGQEDIVSVATAVHGHTSLEELHLHGYSVALINRGLVNHHSLQDLTIDFHYGTDDEQAMGMFLGAIRDLLDSLTPLEKLTLNGHGNDEIADTTLVDQNLASVLSSLHAHRTLRECVIELSGKNIPDEFPDHVAAMLRANQSIEVLSTPCLDWQGVATILEALDDGPGANCTLRELRLRGSDNIFVLVPVPDDNSREEAFSKIIRLLPRMENLKKLNLETLNGPQKLHLRTELLNAFEQNESLTTVNAFPVGVIPEHRELSETINYYCNRNRHRPVWTAAKNTEKLLGILQDLHANHPHDDDLTGLSLTWEALCDMVHLYAASPSPPSFSSISSRPRSSKKRKRTTP